MLTGAWGRWSPGVCAALVLAGCSRGDPTVRYDVAGTVTFAGKPVPVGAILFAPDGSRGNRGPAGFARIRNGKYDTALGGKGSVGGPQEVRITGFDGNPAMELPDGAPLFPDYVVAIELPEKKTTFDFNVSVSGPKK